MDLLANETSLHLTPRLSALRAAKYQGKYGKAAAPSMRLSWINARPGVPASRARLRTDGTLTVDRSPGTREEIALARQGFEQRWTLDTRPQQAGDVLVRLRVDGYEFDRATPSGLHFRDRRSGARVRYGIATWVDAAGQRTTITPRWIEDQIELRVPADIVAAASYPATIDPLISAERLIDVPLPDAQSWHPNLAVSAGTTNYLVAWAGAPLPDGSTPLYAMRVRVSDGTPEDLSPILLSTSHDNEVLPSIAFDGTSYFVSWVSYGATYALLANRINAGTGAVELSQPLVLPGAGLAYVSYAEGYYLVAHVDQCSLYATRVRASDLAVQSTVTVALSSNTPFTCYVPSSISVAGDNFVIGGIRTVEIDDDNEEATAMAWRISPTTGASLDPNGIVGSGATPDGMGRVSSAFDGESVLLAWQQIDYNTLTTRLYGARIDAGAGVLRTASPIELQPVQSCNVEFGTTSAAFTGATSWVGWSSCDAGSIHLSRVPAEGTGIADFVAVQGPLSGNLYAAMPALASAGGDRALLVYQRGEPSGSEYAVVARLIAESGSIGLDLQTDLASYPTGATVSVTFAGLPGAAGDWIAIAEDGTPNPSYVKFLYTGGAVAGTLQFSGLSGGTYRARAFSNNTYDLLRESAAFTVGAAGPRSVSTSASSYLAGATVEVSFANLAGYAADWIAIAEDGSSHTDYVQFQYTGGATNGTISFSGLSGGTYRARVFKNNGYEIEAESQAFTIAPGGVPSVASDVPSYVAGGTVTASFANLAGYAHDWIAVAQIDTPPTSYVRFAYTNGATGGVLSFDGLSGGTYVLRAFKNNSYTLQAESAPFTIAQAGVPAVTADRGSYGAGDTIVITYSGLVGYTTDWIVITGDGAPATSYIRFTYTGGATSGTVSFSGLSSGTYRARAFLNNGYTLQAESAPFTIETGTLPSVTTDALSYAAGASVTVHFAGLAGYTGDWIAIAESGSSATSYLKWAYTGGAQQGDLTFSGLAGATYRVRAFRDGGYDLQAESASFTVATNTPAAIAASAAVYVPGAQVVINYAGLLGYSTDWIAVALDGAPLTANIAYLYTSGAQQGAATFSSLPPGHYRARAFANNSYNLQAESAAFSIASPNGAPCSTGLQCLTGYCSDGVCCDSACDGACDACSKEAGALTNGTCMLVGGEGIPSCGGYQCSTMTADCPASCSEDDECTTGFRCSSGQCVSVCIAGVCTCSTGQHYCEVTNRCILDGSCCADADCATPYDCHTATGARCLDHVCTYPPVTCASGQACTAGSCSDAVVSFLIVPNASSYLLDDLTAAFKPISFTAILQNVSSSPVAVSGIDIGNVEVISASVNGVPVPPSAGTFSLSSDPNMLQQNALIALAPQQRTTFQIHSLATYVTESTQSQQYIGYIPNSTGTLAVQLAYHYSGGAGAFSNVIGQTVLSNVVTINVQ